MNIIIPTVLLRAMILVTELVMCSYQCECDRSLVTYQEIAKPLSEESGEWR